MKKRRMIVALMLTCMMLLSMVSASAESITTYADTEFVSAYPTLLSSESVTFKCSTYEIKSSLSVTACWLQRDNNGVWTKICNLTPPSKVSTNTFAYSATVDYSSKIGVGTYRVWATFNADGHEITRCSNERTF